MKKLSFYLAFSLSLFLVACSKKEVVPETAIIIEPVGQNYLVLKPTKFILKSDNNFPIIYLEHYNKEGDVFDESIESGWYQKNGDHKKFIDITYYDKKSLPTSLNYVVLDTIGGINYSMYTDEELYPAMVNSYLAKSEQLLKEGGLVMPGEKSFFWLKVKVKYINYWLKYDNEKKEIATFNTEIIKDEIRPLPLILTILMFMTTLLIAFKKPDEINYWRFISLISLVVTAVLTSFFVSSVTLYAREVAPIYTNRIFYGFFGGMIFFVIFGLLSWIKESIFKNGKNIYLIFLTAISGSVIFKIITYSYLPGLYGSLIVFAIIFAPVLVMLTRILWSKKSKNKENYF